MERFSLLYKNRTTRDYRTYGTDNPSCDYKVCATRLLTPSNQEALSATDIERLHQLEEQMSKQTENRPLKGKIDPLQLDSSGFVKVGFTATEAQELIHMKRSNSREDFYFKFMDYAIRKNPEWANHLEDYRE
ncbi:MAG: hypothetical protein II623_09785 [Paludibacteraceae bacterium]|nr:hypothetical protein [Paludibacteraceae bacterium]